MKMIKKTDGDDYESARSLNQELTFLNAERFFAEENIPLGQEQKCTLGLISEDGVFTNLGLLFSDQCTRTAKLAVFQGSSKTIFKDRAEFSGLKRVDTRDYPPEALRKALFNAIVHRDYSYSGLTFTSIFDDRIEFVSLGGLPKGIAMSDVMMGVSVPRNRRLVNVFIGCILLRRLARECYSKRR